MDFRKPSDKALKDIDSIVGKRKYNFPFDKVPIGYSFPVDKSEVKSLQILRAIASREGIKLGRNFRVAEHEDVFEVYYHSDRKEASPPPVGKNEPVPPQEPVNSFFAPSAPAGTLAKAEGDAHREYRFQCYHCGAHQKFTPHIDWKTVSESEDKEFWLTGCTACRDPLKVRKDHVNMM